MNSIGGDTVALMNFAIDEVEKNFKGLVVGNQGGNFSAGANIMMLLLAARILMTPARMTILRSFVGSASLAPTGNGLV